MAGGVSRGAQILLRVTDIIIQKTIQCIQMELQLPLSMSVYVSSTNGTKILILKYSVIFAELALVKRNFQNILGLIIFCCFGVQELL